VSPPTARRSKRRRSPNARAEEPQTLVRDIEAGTIREIVRAMDRERAAAQAAERGGAHSDADSVAASWLPASKRSQASEWTDPGLGQLTRTGLRYELLEELGRGAMGTVRLARDVDLRREVALKTLLPDEAHRPGPRSRLLREARLAGGLEHPNIVPVHELGAFDDGQPFFTMRRLQGRSLADVLAAQRMGDATALEEYGRVRQLTVFIQVCLSLEFAHSHGVVHRDVKPGNIMLGDFGEVLLLDWGIAKRTDSKDPGESTDGLTLTGTPGYMAPEQILMDASVSPQLADVYALGAILYEMLTLRRPIEDPDAEDLMVRCCTEDPVPPSRRAPERGIPPELDDLCMKALAREPQKRTASARALAREAEHFLEGVRERERLFVEAEEKVLEGQSLTARYEALRQELAFTLKEARDIRSEVRPWHGVDTKRPMWELEDRARSLREEVVDAFGEATKAFAGALDRVPDHREARLGLAHLWWSRFVDDEASGSDIAARHSRRMVEDYDDGGFAERLRGDGRLTLLTDPAQVEVRLCTYVEKDRVRVPAHERVLGKTPLRGVPVPMGSHLLVLEHAGFPPVRYPINIARLQHHEGYVRLYAQAEIGDGMVYVPGGPFLARGGSTEYGDEEDLRELILPDFAIAKYPVTFRQYLEFIDALQESDPEQALARCPRTALEGRLAERDSEGRWRPIYELLMEGRIREIYSDPESVWELPVVAVSWDDAGAWCEWATRRDEREIRLPSENEWEKAARGVDGRKFPWGDAYDATFANWSGSRPWFSQLEPIGTYPMDESVYGVRDMCGGAGNWCSNWFKRDQETRAYRGNNWSTATARSLAERSGSFPKTCSGTVGFRVARAMKR
jgi:serine/threonine-protein kinase